MTEKTFVSYDGKEIGYREWKPENPTGLVQIAHGMAESTVRYDDFAEYLKGRGFLVFGDDHRGHGLTDPGKTGYCEGEMFEDIVSSLGGRVAEQLILEDISTGASNDLQQATNIARQMITKYGFSERLGPVVYGTSQEETFLGRDLGQGKGYSETTAAEIDSETRDIIDEAYETCRRTLTEHIDQLHALAQALICLLYTSDAADE